MWPSHRTWFISECIFSNLRGKIQKSVKLDMMTIYELAGGREFVIVSKLFKCSKCWKLGLFVTQLKSNSDSTPQLKLNPDPA